MRSSAAQAERGSATASTVLAVALSLGLLVLAADLGSGRARMAMAEGILSEAVRAGSVVGADSGTCGRLLADRLRSAGFDDALSWCRRLDDRLVASVEIDGKRLSVSRP